MKSLSLHLKKARIVLLLALMSIAGAAQAYDYLDEDSGLQYEFNGDEATVVGCVSGTTDIDIPDVLSVWNEDSEDYDDYNVVAVADNAFQNNTTITDVTIGDNVTEIGDYAFSGCTGITSVTFGSGITTIGDYAFNGCANMSGDLSDLPDGIESIGQYAFNGCAEMSGDLDFSDTGFSEITSIGSHTFTGTGITSVTLTETITELGDAAFQNCTSISSITLNSDITTFGANVFSGCGDADYGLTLTIGEDVTEVSTDAFVGLNNISTLYFNATECSAFSTGTTSFFDGADNVFETLYIDDNVTIIPDFAFKGCAGLTDVTLPSALETLGESAFAGCASFTAIDLSDCSVLTEIPDNAFNGCVLVESINTGDNVTAIGENAFAYCGSNSDVYSLTITIGEAVTEIDGTAFTGCQHLTELTFNAIELETMDNEGTSLFAGTVGDADGFTLTLGDDVTIIPDYAFKGCKGISSLPTIPETLETIGVSAFEGCEEMSGDLDFSDSQLTEIAASAFKTCKALTGINTGDEVTEIGDNAFNGCSEVTEITIGIAVETIGTTAFTGCNALETLNYNAINCTSGMNTGSGTSITSIFKKTNSAFTSFATLNIGDEVEVIPDGAFRGCTELTGDLSLPETLTTIGAYAFAGDTQLSGTIEIPETLETIGQNAFQNCNALEGDLDFSECEVTTIPTYAFSGTAITSVVIGDNITEIGVSAFMGTSSTNEVLTSVNIGKSVTTIGTKAFGTNKALAEIIFNASGTCSVSTTNNSYTFSGCNNNGVNLEVTIGEDVTAVPSALFMSLQHITKVTFDAKACTSMQNSGGTASLFPKPALVEEVEIGEDVTIIPAYAFYGFTIMDNSSIDLSNVTTIGANAFYNCNAWSGTADLSNIESLGANAFYQCKAITEIVIGDKLTTIPASAFYYCYEAGELTIGSSVTTIESNAFARLNYNNAANSGATITSRAATAPSLANAFANNVYNKGSLTVPCGSYSSYQSATNWSTFHTKNNLSTDGLYELLVSSEDVAMGTAALTQGPCDNGEHGDGFAIVEATPASSLFNFVNWTDEDGEEVSTANPYTFTPTSDMALVAHFELALVADCIFEGTEDELWSNANNWSNQTLPTSESIVLVNANVNVSAADAVAASVAIATDKVMTVNGTLTVSGDINSLAATSVVINDGGQVSCANDFLGTAKKTIAAYTDDAEEADGWHLIASPLAEAGSINGLLANDYDLYYFDQTQENEWINHEDQNDGGFAIATKGQKGYLYANDTDTELEFVGTLNGTTAPELSLVFDDNAPLAGWNLVGNPFTCEAFIDGDYYRMNEQGTELTAASGGIAPLEGVFVQATTDGESLQFSKEQASGNRGNLTMSVSQGRGSVDVARVRFGNGRNMGKLMLNDSHSKLYIPENDKRYAVVSVSEADGEMPVNFEASENGTYTIAIATEDIDVHYLHLIDNLTGMDVDLMQTPSYTFEARTSDYASRFRLVFNASSIDSGDSFAYFDGSSFVIANDGKATLQVVDVMGRVLSTETINGNATIDINQAAGVYMLRLVNGNDVKVQKIVVR